MKRLGVYSVSADSIWYLSFKGKTSGILFSPKGSLYKWMPWNLHLNVIYISISYRKDIEYTYSCLI